MTASPLIRTVCWLVAMLTLPGYASVIVNGTRVVYDGAQREVSVRLTNTGSLPVLAQSWIDTGDKNAAPESIQSPFILTPPINRINPEKSQNLRISYSGSRVLPEDRESVFWLNVLEIKPDSRESGKNQIQMAFRTRIKLFYRPAALASREKVAAAANGLKWTVSGDRLTAINDSPYFVSLVEVSLKGHDKRSAIEGEMVPPAGRYTFTLPKHVRAAAGSVLTYQYVNDWGAIKTAQYTL